MRYGWEPWYVIFCIRQNDWRLALGHLCSGSSLIESGVHNRQSQRSEYQWENLSSAATFVYWSYPLSFFLSKIPFIEPIKRFNVSILVYVCGAGYLYYSCRGNHGENYQIRFRNQLHNNYFTVSFFAISTSLSDLCDTNYIAACTFSLRAAIFVWSTHQLWRNLNVVYTFAWTTSCIDSNLL